MQTMKNKVDRKLAKTWLGKHLIKVGQKVDEVWMTVGQYLVKSWSAFKANKVGQNLDKSWTDFGESSWQKWAIPGIEKVQQGYNHDTTLLQEKVCQRYARIPVQQSTPNLLQYYSKNHQATSPVLLQKLVVRGYTKATPTLH